jgi:hypothetical protein
MIIFPTDRPELRGWRNEGVGGMHMNANSSPLNLVAFPSDYRTS